MTKYVLCVRMNNTVPCVELNCTFCMDTNNDCKTSEYLRNIW